MSEERFDRTDLGRIVQEHVLKTGHIWNGRNHGCHTCINLIHSNLLLNSVGDNKESATVIMELIDNQDRHIGRD